jgi:hypothetical protein
VLLLSLAGCPSRTTDSVRQSATPAPAVDPNCQVNVVAGGAIPNYFGVPNNAQRNDATNAIAQLTYGDLYRNPPFSIAGPAGLVRLDVQGVIAGGGRNWQVQINGIVGHSTVSTMLITGAVGNASTPDRQAYVQRSARNALNQSLATGNVYSVTGFCN